MRRLLTRLLVAALFGLSASTAMTASAVLHPTAIARADDDDHGHGDDHHHRDRNRCYGNQNNQGDDDDQGDHRNRNCYDNNCGGGYWLGRVWIPGGNCTNCNRRGDNDDDDNNRNCGYYNNNGGYYNGGGYTNEVSGIVTALSGSRITILAGFRAINIDARQAYNNGQVRNLGIGATVTAYGRYSGNTFYAYRVE